MDRGPARVLEGLMKWPKWWAVNGASPCEEWELNLLDTKADVHWILSEK